MLIRSRHNPQTGASRFLLFLVASVLGIQGCASVPQEAPELSAELGKRIAAIETAHINMLHRFMDEKRRQVDEFLIREWVPKFAENLFAEQAVIDLWNQACTSNDTSFRLEFISGLGTRVQAKINEQRLELIKPLDEAEKAFERRLRADYAEAKAINNVLTSFLSSTAKVAENRDRFLNMLGVKDDLVETIDAIDEAVTDLVTKKKAAEGAVNTIEKAYKDEIKKAVDELKSAGRGSKEDR
jgi:hypothetical protein